MRRTFLKYLSLQAMALLSLTAFSQGNTNTISPYSNFGIGDLTNTSTSHFKGMGGIGVGMFSDRYINLSNPASYSNLKLTNFEFGMNGSLVKLDQGNLSQEENFANFSHLVFAAPFGEKWSGAFGLIPISHIGYEAVITDVQDLPGDTAKYKLIHKGEGGLNQAFVGGAYKLNDDLSIGLNVNFIYGQIETIRDEQYEDPTYLSTRRTQEVNIQDMSYTFGLQYNKALSEERFLSAGITYKAKTDLASEERLFVNSYSNSGFLNSLVDTLVDKKIQEGDVTLPSEIGIGFGLRQLNKWNVGADLRMINWSEFSKFGVKDNALKDMMSVAVGGSYTPNYKDIRKFLNRIEYRGGIRYTDGLVSLSIEDDVSNTDITEFGINFGFGIPVRKNGSTLNLDFELGQRGTDDNSLVKEDYFKFQVSMSLRDKWFVRRKID